MTRIAFLKKYAMKFAIALVLLCLIVYTLGHALGSSANSLLTTPLRSVTDQRITSAQAYLFRDEEVLSSSAVGLVDESVESGTRVAKNTSVVTVWQRSESADEDLFELQEDLDRINRRLRILSGSVPGTSESEGDANGYRAEASALYMEICAAAQRGELERIPALEEQMLMALNRYLILSGKSEEILQPMIDDLQDQKWEILGGRSAETLRNEARSGVFYSREYVDGYESFYTLEAVRELTEDSFSALREKENTRWERTTVGKMVYGYEWYAVMELPRELIGGFTVGEDYEITFPENGGRSLTLTLERVDGSMAVFRAEDSPTDFVYYRMQTAQITLDVREGFYIPNSALYTVDGKIGVYVLENSTAYFRRVKILYRGNGYSIAAQSDGESEVYPNDLIITAGKNLYDGKVYE